MSKYLQYDMFPDLPVTVKKEVKQSSRQKKLSSKIVDIGCIIRKRTGAPPRQYKRHWA